LAGGHVRNGSRAPAQPLAGGAGRTAPTSGGCCPVRVRTTRAGLLQFGEDRGSTSGDEPPVLSVGRWSPVACARRARPEPRRSDPDTGPRDPDGTRHACACPIRPSPCFLPRDLRPGPSRCAPAPLSTPCRRSGGLRWSRGSPKVLDGYH
jgi:hypothetical protein